MTMIEYLQHRFANKTFWIIGAGREGISSYALLRETFPEAEIKLIDDQPLENLSPQVAELAQDPHSQFTLASALRHQDFKPGWIVFKTPGIPSDHPIIKQLTQVSAEITSNTALFLELLKQLAAPPTTIGVTGTKGKSTTASLIYHILKENGKMAFLAGNIGTPPLTLVETIAGLEKPAEAQVVLELSSHQLRELTISPDIAVIQNITPEHLNYYSDFKSYQNAKRAITMYQNVKQSVIYCPRHDAVVTILNDLSQRFTFDVEPANPANLTAYATTEAIYYGTEKIIDRQDIPLVGIHNLYNILPGVIVGKLFGLDANKIAQAIKTFQALPHRLEFVAEQNGVSYYNDSQATTPEAATAALRSFSGTPIHLLAGGSDKGVDLGMFADEIVQQPVKTLILFPPMGASIAQLVRASAQKQQKTEPEIYSANSMPEAVLIAKSKAQTGDIVLLSPACASFGIFKNYQDRGDQFKIQVAG
ncbi:MAG: UDP-N-acetylmuramoyl-L-alanine--D-glutamate ligase [Candidatus Pacebacteria bacterium CG10_big_fil_rev_8_21_14_0_10_44_11]|nr:MAG: UDP-N-acetylmuramoyl-L-alanine--D-glutamate ligase [Candidatus Pacebacteria bacterium CG10_big_fil_rev_8_21_14_0_10_44_11]